MRTIKQLLKSFDCQHDVRRVHHDFARMRATVTCDRCGAELTTFELKQQADVYQVAEGE